WATAAWLQAALWGAKFAGLLDRRRTPNALAGVSYETSDKRWVLLSFVEEDKNFADFVKAMGRPELLTDPRFANAKSRHANASALVAEIDKTFATQPLSHWKPALDEARVPYGVAQIPEEIVKDPQLYANNVVVPIADGSAQPKYTVNSPMTIKESPKVAPRPAPGLGEHTEEILREMGFDAGQIDALRAAGAIPKQKEHAKVA